MATTGTLLPGGDVEAVTALVPVEARTQVAAALGDFADRALEIKVVDADSHRAAGESIITLRRLRADIVRIIKPVKDQANRVHKAITAFEARFTSRIDQADAHVEAECLVYERAEKKRLAQEEADRQAAAAALAAKTETAVVEAAAKAEAEGDVETAAAIIETATAPRMPVLGPVARATAAPVATPGLATTESWSAALDPADPGAALLALVRAIAAGTAPLACVKINETVLNATARSLKYAHGKQIYPGVVSVVTESKKRSPGAGAVSPEAGM